MDRLEMIKAAAAKVQAAAKFKTKVKAKGRKVAKKVTAESKSVSSVDAFDEKFMYDDEKTVARVWRESGVVDSYRETIKYDNEWN